MNIVIRDEPQVRATPLKMTSLIRERAPTHARPPYELSELPAALISRLRALRKLLCCPLQQRLEISAEFLQPSPGSRDFHQHLVQHAKQSQSRVKPARTWLEAHSQ